MFVRNLASFPNDTKALTNVFFSATSAFIMAIENGHLHVHMTLVFILYTLQEATVLPW